MPSGVVPAGVLVPVPAAIIGAAPVDEARRMVSVLMRLERVAPQVVGLILITIPPAGARSTWPERTSNITGPARPRVFRSPMAAFRLA